MYIATVHTYTTCMYIHVCTYYIHDIHTCIKKREKKWKGFASDSSSLVLQAPDLDSHTCKHPITDESTHATTQSLYSLLLPRS